MVVRAHALVLTMALAATGAIPGGAQHASSIGTWAASPVSAHAGPDAGKADETLREIVHVSVAGEQAIVTLSNEFGTEPLTIGGASVGLSGGAGRVAGVVKLTFGGKAGTVIPAGGFVRSDLAAFRFPALSDLAVSLFVPAQAMGEITQHEFANTTNYVAAGDQVLAPVMEGARTMSSWRYLKEVAVSEADGRGVGDVVCLGASITDGAHSTKDANLRWTDVLARRLQLRGEMRGLGVMNEGIGGNRILHDGTGPSALARFDRDVLQGLSASGQNFLIVMEGSNDIGHATDPKKPYDIVSAEDMIAGYTELARRAHAHGIRVFGGTLPPFLAASYGSAAGDVMRRAVNQWMRTTKELDGMIDFDKAVSDPADPTRMLPAYDSGDHLHPNDAGYKAMGEAIDLKLFRR